MDLILQAVQFSSEKRKICLRHLLCNVSALNTEHAFETLLAHLPEAVPMLTTRQVLNSARSLHSHLPILLSKGRSLDRSKEKSPYPSLPVSPKGICTHVQYIQYTVLKCEGFSAKKETTIHKICIIFVELMCTAMMLV